MPDVWWFISPLTPKKIKQLYETVLQLEYSGKPQKPEEQLELGHTQTDLESISEEYQIAAMLMTLQCDIVILPCVT